MQADGGHVLKSSFSGSGHTHAYLPLTGGIITGASYNMLTLARSNVNGSSILFKNSAGNLGKLGFASNGVFHLGNGASTDGVGNLLQITSTGDITAYGNINATGKTITATTFSGNATSATSATSATNLSRSIVAGNGLSGGGALNANRTLTLGTPSTLTAATTDAVTATSHTHAIDGSNLVVLESNRLNVPDTRSVDSLPSSIPNASITAFFKTNAIVNAPPVTTGASYAHILNMNGYNSGNTGGGGHTTQLAFGDSLAIRQSTSTTAWGAWTRLALVTDNVASATKVNNKLILKFDTGTTENTNLYTYDGSAAKTIDIKAGSNVSFTKAGY